METSKSHCPYSSITEIKFHVQIQEISYSWIQSQSDAGNHGNADVDTERYLVAGNIVVL